MLRFCRNFVKSPLSGDVSVFWPENKCPSGTLRFGVLNEMARRREIAEFIF